VERGRSGWKVCEGVNGAGFCNWMLFVMQTSAKTFPRSHTSSTTNRLLREEMLLPHTDVSTQSVAIGNINPKQTAVVLFQPTSRRLRTCARTLMRICLLPSPATFTMFYVTSFRLSLKGLNTTIYVNVHTASPSPLELDISQTRTSCSACCT